MGAGDLAAQVEQAYLNVATALASVGGSFADVAKLTVYVVDWSPEKLADLGAGAAASAWVAGCLSRSGAVAASNCCRPRSTS